MCSNLPTYTNRSYYTSRIDPTHCCQIYLILVLKSKALRAFFAFSQKLRQNVVPRSSSFVRSLTQKMKPYLMSLRRM